MAMNNLIKKSDITNLSPVARDVYVASNKPMIKSYEDLNIVVNAIHVSITQVIADKGVRLETEDINYLKQNICRDIIHDFNTLSLEDVNVCFRMGVRGKLGEYYGINVATLYQWLEKYKNEIIPEMNKEIHTKLPKPMEIETEVDYKTFDNSLVKTIQNILIGEIELNNYNDYGNVHYNLLDKFNFVQFTPDEKIEIFNRAKDVVKHNLTKKNLSLIEQGKSIQVINTEKFLNEIELNSKTNNDIVIIEAKKIAFRDCLSRIENTEKFIEELTQKIEEHYGKK
jgi:hypothetical protein